MSTSNIYRQTYYVKNMCVYIYVHNCVGNMCRSMHTKNNKFVQRRNMSDLQS